VYSLYARFIIGALEILLLSQGVSDASSVGDALAGWPVTVGVVEVGVVDVRYGVSQPGPDDER